MDIIWNKDVLNLEKLIQVTRNDKDKLKQYLNQFKELIPTRISLLEQYTGSGDRKMIRQTVHQVSPQLHYFGLQGVDSIVLKIEREYTTMPLNELNELVGDLIDKMEKAREEVNRILASGIA